MMMAMEKKNKNEEEDVFSELPDDVIVHILSFLDTPTAARTCMLSKRLTPFLWQSFPSLILPFCSPRNSDFHVVSHLIYTISKRHKTLRKLCIGFQLLSLSDDQCMSFRNLMRLAFRKCSGELELSFNFSENALPLDPLFSSAPPKSLTSMKFINCNFKSLHDVISSCPQLRELSLVHCLLEAEVRISGTQQLRALVLDRCGHINNELYRSGSVRIHIETKNLQTFSYCRANYNEPFMFTETPDSLKSLTLAGDLSRDFGKCRFYDRISKFLALESLSIHAQGPRTDVVKISSQSLKSLELISYSKVIIDSPMLTSLTLENSNSFSIHGLGSITSLVLRKVDCIPKRLEKLLAECKLLRQLKLLSCTLNEKINISHMELERLDI